MTNPTSSASTTPATASSEVPELTLRPASECRYDIVSLFWTGRRFVVTHFPDAFRPVSDPGAPWKWTV